MEENKNKKVTSFFFFKPGLPTRFQCEHRNQKEETKPPLLYLQVNNKRTTLGRGYTFESMGFYEDGKLGKKKPNKQWFFFISNHI